MSLARDAGDMVAAESYFQHAEHYNRIIMATRIQSGGDGGDIRDRRDGGRNMPGLASEHGRPEGGNGTEANHDANGSDQGRSSEVRQERCRSGELMQPPDLCSAHSL